MRDDEISAELEPRIPGLRRYAYALTRNGATADDLVQDTLERAIGHWHLRRRDGSLKAWLVAIAHNLHLGSLRRIRRRGEHVGSDHLDDVAAPEAPPDHSGLRRDILAGLDSLPEDQRAVLVLIAVEDLSYQDAARVLDIPLGTVMSRLSRARARLRAFMADSRADPGADPRGSDARGTDMRSDGSSDEGSTGGGARGAVLRRVK